MGFRHTIGGIFDTIALGITCRINARYRITGYGIGVLRRSSSVSVVDYLLVLGRSGAVLDINMGQLGISLDVAPVSRSGFGTAVGDILRILRGIIVIYRTVVRINRSIVCRNTLVVLIDERVIILYLFHVIIIILVADLSGIRLNFRLHLNQSSFLRLKYRVLSERTRDALTDSGRRFDIVFDCLIVLRCILYRSGDDAVLQCIVLCRDVCIL